MHTLLTFEVHEPPAEPAQKAAVQQAAANLRDEIESILKKDNWRSVDIHTTFTLESTNPVDLSMTFEPLLRTAYATRGIRVPIKVRYTYLHGQDKATPRTFDVPLRP